MFARFYTLTEQVTRGKEKGRLQGNDSFQKDFRNSCVMAFSDMADGAGPGRQFFN